LYERGSTFFPSHELLSHDHPSSEKDDEWTYLKSLKEMDEASMDKEWQLYLESLKEVSDEEDLTTDLNVLSQQENNSEESYLTEGDRVVVDMKEIPIIHLDKEEEDTIVGCNDEEYSHLSIENQDTIEDQRDEGSIDDSNTREPTLPLPDKSADLIAYFAFQPLDFHDTSCSDLKGNGLVGSPSQNGKHDGIETENIDAFDNESLRVTVVGRSQHV
jgi:hypothetical protein